MQLVQERMGLRMNGIQTLERGVSVSRVDHLKTLAAVVVVLWAIALVLASQGRLAGCTAPRHAPGVDAPEEGWSCGSP